MEITGGNKMITKLTEAQEKMIPVYLKKWLDVGYRTSTIDREKAKESVNFLYEKILRKDRPKLYIFLDSPLQCQMAMNLIKEKGPDLRTQLGNHFDTQLRTHLDTQLDTQLDTHLSNQLVTQLDDPLTTQLRTHLDHQLSTQLRNQLDDQLGSKKLNYFYPSISNWYLRYYWFWVYDYVLNELFPEKGSKPDFKLFNEFMEGSKQYHQVYMFDEIVFLSDFPQEINVTSEGRLHSNKGPALLYKDGSGVYSLNGIRVPKEIALLKPEEITKDIILKQENADYRREIVRKLTGKQLIDVLNPKVIDSKYGYELFSIDLGDERKRPFLKMQNPSINAVHVEGVLPETKTVEDALEYRNGRSGLPITLDGVELFSEYLGRYFQQGDCIFSIESELPGGAVKCDHNIAGEGLIRHVQSGGTLYEKDGIRYLTVDKEARISHPEHKDTVLTEGVYKISKVKEYDHWKEESREVID